MAIVAILVDGGFYQKRAQYLWHDAAPEERANELCAYCKRHIHQHDHLYRIFYYDCPPSDKKVFHPLTQQQVDLGRSEMYAWMTSFQKEMKKKRKVALRLGRLQDTELYYTLKTANSKKALRSPNEHR